MAAVSFDDSQVATLDFLVSRKTMLACQALTTAPNSWPRFSWTRIDDLVLKVAAFWAPHDWMRSENRPQDIVVLYRKNTRLSFGEGAQAVRTFRAFAWAKASAFARSSPGSKSRSFRRLRWCWARPYQNYACSRARVSRGSNRVYFFRNVNATSPVGPFRCFAIISSASLAISFFASSSVS